MTGFLFKKMPRMAIAIGCLLCIFSLKSAHPTIEVPEKMSLGSMHLQLNQGIRRQLQSQINFLLKNRQFLNHNAGQIQLYLNEVSKILLEEGLPDEYKYLAIMENSLITGAIQSESAGFWQIRPEIAEEFGLQINERVDERLNLISTTRVASKYLKRTNLYFKNWLINMLTMELGFKETKEYLSQNYRRRDEIIGVQEVQIDEMSHPFIRKFLAHKILLESLLQQNPQLKVKLVQYTRGANKTLPQIAKKTGVSTQELKKHNPWLKKNRIPKDKIYTVVIPQKMTSEEIDISDKSNSEKLPSKSIDTLLADPYRDLQIEPEKKPEISTQNVHNEQLRKVIEEQEREMSLESINPPAPLINTPEEEMPEYHTVINGQTLYSIARMYQDKGLTVKLLRDLNNLKPADKIYPAQLLRLRAIQTEITIGTVQSNMPKIHLVQAGETLMDIATRYNLSPRLLRMWNQMSIEDEVKPGQKLLIESGSNSNLKSANPNENPKSFQLKRLRGRTSQKLSESSEVETMRGTNSPKSKNFKIQLNEPEIKK
jgi:membrane-bound lytic murein transglycosylase D